MNTKIQMGLIHNSLLLLLLLFAPVSLVLAGQHAHRDLQQVARNFLLERNPLAAGRIEVEVKRPDRRLKLSQCTQAVEAFLPSSSQTRGNTLVGLRCDDQQPWTLYLPAKVSVFAPVVVAEGRLERGRTIARSDLRIEERDLARLRGGWFQDPAQLTGKTVRRPVAAGAALRPGQVAKPKLVRRGQRVTILARSGSIQVRMKADALGDGVMGERIRVRNRATRKILEAIVQSSSIVVITI